MFVFQMQCMVRKVSKGACNAIAQINHVQLHLPPRTQCEHLEL